MKPTSERTELDLEDVASKLDRIEAVMGHEIVEPFHQLLHGYVMLLQLVDEQAREIVRLEKQCYGSSTERTSQIFPSPPSEASDAGEHTRGNDAAAGESTASVDSQPSSVPPEDPNTAPRRRRRGHGRTPARAYTGCVQTMVTHPSLHPGDCCPHCAKGTMYRQHCWSPEVRLKGQVPVIGTVYHLERLRCHLCGALETAPLPEEAGSEKYDPTVASIVGTLRYGEGLPWNRLQRLQRYAAVPMPASVQWQLVRDARDRGIKAAYDHLLGEGAQGELMHNDDPGAPGLALEEKLKKQQPLLEKDPDRRGVFTTGILSHADNRPPIALFFTGPYHSGENLRDLLGRRDDRLPPPIQMCDALSRNMPKDLKVIVGNCLAHGRRNFVDVVASFPSEVRYVLEHLKTVYKIDAEAKKRALSAEERLRLHQEQSGPVMEELKRWLKQQFEQKKVEPNSSLGGAISYMLRHWEPLTLFLRVAGAPLDNNVCEQALKMAIRHRKNSLFYKTTNGAAVGDMYMSLIHTCYLCGANPFDYLTQLQRNHDRVQAAPGDWMPWNYQQQLTTAEQSPTPTDVPPSQAAMHAGPTPDG
jgi:transposase